MGFREIFPRNFIRKIDQVFGQVFDQIFAQGFDQGLAEGKNHKYTVQYFPALRKKQSKPQKTSKPLKL